MLHKNPSQGSLRGIFRFYISPQISHFYTESINDGWVSIRRTASCSGERSSLLLQKRESDAYERTDSGDRPLLRRA